MDEIIWRIDYLSDNGSRYVVELQHSHDLWDSKADTFLTISRYPNALNKPCPSYYRDADMATIDWSIEEISGNYKTPLVVRDQIDRMMRMKEFW